MGAGRILSRGGGSKSFSLNFPGETKSGKTWFFPRKTKKTTFFAENVKIQGAKYPLPPFWCPWIGCFYVPAKKDHRIFIGLSNRTVWGTLATTL